MQWHCYSTYGQCIASEIPLPELPTLSDDPDVVVREQDLPSRASHLPPDAGLLYESIDGRFSVYETGSDLYWFREGVGTLRVRDGREIAFQVVSDIPPIQCRQFILGPGLRSLLTQQGYLVFHASANVIDDQAVVFIGESGRGKSTTAAALHTFGHPLLTDDVTPVIETVGGFAVLPGFSAAKLSPTDGANLDSMQLTEERGRTDIDRHYFEALGNSLNDQYPIERVYLLEWAEELSVDPFSANQLTNLLRSSYRLYESNDLESFATHFRECSRFADSVTTRILRRPKDSARLDDVASAIKSDCRG